MNFETGSVRPTLPSSISIRIATPVTGLVEEAMRKIASVRIGAFDSTSITPRASWWTTRPRRATSVTAPEIFFWSM